MHELDTCLEIVRDIRAKDESILTIRYRTMSPKNQVLTGMPIGGGGGKSTAMDNYLIRVEKLNKAKERLQKQLDCEWNNVVGIFADHGITDAEMIALMQYRFYFGYPWKKCSAKMQEEYPKGRWNINKCFRTYRDILHKTGN